MITIGPLRRFNLDGKFYLVLIACLSIAAVIALVFVAWLAPEVFSGLLELWWLWLGLGGIVFAGVILKVFLEKADFF